MIDGVDLKLLPAPTLTKGEAMRAIMTSTEIRSPEKAKYLTEWKRLNGALTERTNETSS